jgi:hypothetical protein
MLQIRGGFTLLKSNDLVAYAPIGFDLTLEDEVLDSIDRMRRLLRIQN